ncbi:sororin [Brachionichthys hirsutus]|uniref:sororin n=1 Tax=Brachionichthys hirsutus TaxID=412623 RepID=UPI0036050925
MNEGTPGNTTPDSNGVVGAQRRRSPRLSCPPQANASEQPVNKMAQTSLAVKRRITVRKIAPRKTAAPSEHNKENTPSRTRSGCSQQKKTNGSTPGPVADPAPSSSAKKKKKAAAAVILSPILPSSPPPSSHPHQPPVDPRDVVWTQKVRRSYGRLSDKAPNSPDSRQNLFGFEKLKTPEVGQRVGRSRTQMDASGSTSGLSSFTSLLEMDDCVSLFPEPDTNIPGVTVEKEKKRRRRRKVQQMNDTELNAMAAKMNAEFEEAEVFELVVE